MAGRLHRVLRGTCLMRSDAQCSGVLCGTRKLEGPASVTASFQLWVADGVNKLLR